LSRSRFFYSAFGLSLAASHEIPGLIPQPASQVIDTQIWLDATPDLPRTERLWYVSAEKENTVPTLRVWRIDDGRYLKLRYSDATEFVVRRDGTAVWATWPSTSTLDDVATYLLGPVLGFVLRLRRILCLHASAIAVEGKSIALLGPAGAGKSTTAAAFGQLGHPVVSDDIVALVTAGNQYWVLPAFPRVRLWPESVELLYGDADALPRLTPTWDKRALDLTHKGYVFQSTMLPLAAIYLLPDALSSEFRGTRVTPVIQPVRGSDSLVTLLANTYAGYLLDTPLREHEFSGLATLATQVPIKRVQTFDRRRPVYELCAGILRDCRAA
jgi:hypothetical protein